MIDPITQLILEANLSRDKFNKKDVISTLSSAHKRISDFLQHKIKEGSCNHIKDPIKQKQCWKDKVIAEKVFEKLSNDISRFIRKYIK
ncbi:MAG: hypothetical protein ACTSWJ_02380 [Candidatus Heimdallarchaeaceae archaeon]